MTPSICERCRMEGDEDLVRYCSSCGRRLDLDGGHSDDRQGTIVRVFATLIVAMVASAGVAAFLLTRPDPVQRTAPSSPSPSATAVSVVRSPLDAWRDVLASLAPDVAASELGTTDGVATIATFDDDTATVWRFQGGAWAPTQVALEVAPVGTSLTGVAVQLVEVTGDGEPDVVIGASGTEARVSAVLSSDGGSWRSLAVEDDGQWAIGVVVDDGRLAIDPACGGACAPGAPAGPWLGLADDGRLVSTANEPPRPLSAEEDDAALTALEALLVDDLGESDGLDCTRPTLLVPGVELRCTWQQRPPQLLQVKVLPSRQLGYKVIGAFELR